MKQCDHGDRASLYALGLLDEAGSSTFERHLSSCPACAAEFRETAALAVNLAGTLPTSVPPTGLRQRVLREVLPPRNREALPRGVAALVRGKQAEWRETPFAGVRIATLYEDPARGEVASLVRMTPGAYYPSHHHAGLEHCYVLEGDLVFEDHALAAGDYSAGSPGADHTVSTTRNGCLLFVVHNVRDRISAH